MTYATFAPDDFAFCDRVAPPRKSSKATVPAAIVLIGSMLFGAWLLADGPPRETGIAPVVAGLRPSVTATASSRIYGVLLDPGFSFGARPDSFTSPALPATNAAASAPVPPAPPKTEALALPQVTAPAVLAASEPQTTSADEQEAAVAGAAQVEAAPVPFPPPRPPEFRIASAQPSPHAPVRTGGPRSAAPLAPVPSPDDRNFLQKFFGMFQPSGSALAYASPEDGLLGRPQGLTSAPMIGADRLTAVYDISAHTVTLPDGTKLEAHSGLGSRLDDPRSVHERNRGATPPHVYELTRREALFHGVQALRLNPVGPGSVFGRDGLLAHTYMLGPNGDSNGCVSFKNYKAFLQAFLNGEVKRLVVVAHAS